MYYSIKDLDVKRWLETGRNSKSHNDALEALWNFYNEDGQFDEHTTKFEKQDALDTANYKVVGHQDKLPCHIDLEI